MILFTFVDYIATFFIDLIHPLYAKKTLQNQGIENEVSEQINE